MLSTLDLHRVPDHTSPASAIDEMQGGGAQRVSHGSLAEEKSGRGEKDHSGSTWSSENSAIYRNLHLRLAIAKDLYLIIGFTRIDQKVILMQLGHQSNSYNLMHIQES
jgi:hypothetical protein